MKDDESAPAAVGIEPAGGMSGEMMEALLSAHLHRIERQFAPLLSVADQLAGVEGQVHRDVRRVVPAWRRATAGELRWPVSLVVVVMITLQMTLRHDLVLASHWLLPAIEATMGIVLVISDPRRVSRRSPVLRALGLGLIGTASLANAWSAVSLISGLVQGTSSVGDSPGALLANGANIWLTNVIVFGLWYWELDRGGPVARAMALKERPDFLFAEMTAQDLAGPDWEPFFFDYLYLAFTNATAFSPTDTLPFSRWAKFAMALQSSIALVTGVLVIARAVNILK